MRSQSSHLTSARARSASTCPLDPQLPNICHGQTVIKTRPLARSLSTLEAAFGQLLPTLLIGRVLSLTMRDK